MKRLFFATACFVWLSTAAQAPPFPTAADIFLGLKKMNVLGSVLYVAAHPDDENTRLLTYFSKDKLYRTGYLSLTRGDGGQNLIGEEQGVQLGLIRTQELLAARRIDGAEQFFTRAFDFGYSKSPEETFTKWNRELILADAVWVIRKFQPDVIITRFPTTGEGGHGQHTASAMIAVEAFSAAADPKRFPEQLAFVKPWQAKRLLWNTFNFGANNTTSPDQFRMDVGGFNALLGKSYGEIAAESRSQHRSQGFGVPRARGEAIEHFKTLAGEAPANDLFDGVVTTWARVPGAAAIEAAIKAAVDSFQFLQPHRSVPALFGLHAAISSMPQDYWRNQKLQEVKTLIDQASGIWAEAFTNEAYVTQGDSIRLNFSINDRAGLGVKLLSVRMDELDSSFQKMLAPNKTLAFAKTIKTFEGTPVTQPYWLLKPMQDGYFDISSQMEVGEPDVAPALRASFLVEVDGRSFLLERPVKYKYVDQVKGEQYQPLTVLPDVSVNTQPGLVLLNRNKATRWPVDVQLTANKNLKFSKADVGLTLNPKRLSVIDANGSWTKGSRKNYPFEILSTNVGTKTIDAIPSVRLDGSVQRYLALASIRYDHIPHIHHFYTDWLRLVPIDLQTENKKIGYIVGAGDKVPEALEQMGYEVTLLTERELERNNLQQFDAIIAGVRAFNANDWMSKYYDKLMKYVQDGGNYIVQYSQSNNLRGKIGPFPFALSNKRITVETAPVDFLKPGHPVLNFPNKITKEDFDGWVQERSLYHADNWDPAYEAILGMADPGEAPHNGSLLVAKYGKGFFSYTGLVFFRQLPAGVPGAYRLLANLIALNKIKSS